MHYNHLSYMYTIYPSKILNQSLWFKPWHFILFLTEGLKLQIVYIEMIYQQPKVTGIDKLIDLSTIGIFHHRLLCLCGLAFMADALEVNLLVISNYILFGFIFFLFILLYVCI